MSYSYLSGYAYYRRSPLRFFGFYLDFLHHFTSCISFDISFDIPQLDSLPFMKPKMRSLPQTESRLSSPTMITYLDISHSITNTVVSSCFTDSGRLSSRVHHTTVCRCNTRIRHLPTIVVNTKITEILVPQKVKIKKILYDLVFF